MEKRKRGRPKKKAVKLQSVKLQRERLKDRNVKEEICLINRIKSGYFSEGDVL